MAACSAASAVRVAQEAFCSGVPKGRPRCRMRQQVAPKCSRKASWTALLSTPVSLGQRPVGFCAAEQGAHGHDRADQRATGTSGPHAAAEAGRQFQQFRRALALEHFHQRAQHRFRTVELIPFIIRSGRAFWPAAPFPCCQAWQSPSAPRGRRVIKFSDGRSGPCSPASRGRRLKGRADDGGASGGCCRQAGACTAARKEAVRPHAEKTHAVRRFPGGCPGEGPQAGAMAGASGQVCRLCPVRAVGARKPCGKTQQRAGCVLFVRRARCIGSAGRQRVSPALPFCQHPFRPAGLQAETGGAAAPGARCLARRTGRHASEAPCPAGQTTVIAAPGGALRLPSSVNPYSGRACPASRRQAVPERSVQPPARIPCCQVQPVRRCAVPVRFRCRASGMQQTVIKSARLHGHRVAHHPACSRRYGCRVPGGKAVLATVAPAVISRLRTRRKALDFQNGTAAYRPWFFLACCRSVFPESALRRVLHPRPVCPVSCCGVAL